MRPRCRCVWLLVAVVQTCALAAKACSICGCGDPLASAAEARLMKGQLRLGLDTEILTARAYVYTKTRLVQMSLETLALTAGTSLPTGDNSVQAEGVRVDEHAQLGTGALGPYAGLLYAFRRDPWNFFGSVTGRLRLRNGYGYKYGSALLWSLRGDCRLVDWLSGGVSCDGRYAARDDRHGVLQSNTGGWVLAAAPGLKLRLHQELWLYGIVQIPVVTHLFGDQRVGPVLIASLQYTFQ